MARILLVDASTTSRLLVVKLLEEDGHHVEESSSGREALEICASAPPDCLILEMVLHELDGFKVLSGLQERNLSVPVIVLTDLRMKSVEEKCKQLGVRAYLKKPARPVQLRKVLGDIVGVEGGSEAQPNGGAKGS
jgi:CheY-like chemotaxis protein